MAIYDIDATTTREIGKVYDNDGTTMHQIGKVYDNNGTTNSLIYQSSLDILNLTEGIDITGGMTHVGNGSLSKVSDGYKVTHDVEEIDGVGDYSMYTKNMINLSEITTLTFTLTNNFNFASSKESGIYLLTYEPSWMTAEVSSYTSKVAFWSHNEAATAGTFTKSLNVASLSGSYYIYFRARLTPTNEKVDCFTFNSIKAV